MGYFVETSKGQQGPFSVGQLQNFVDSGKLALSIEVIDEHSELRIDLSDICQDPNQAPEEKLEFVDIEDDYSLEDEDGYSIPPAPSSRTAPKRSTPRPGKSPGKVKQYEVRSDYSSFTDSRASLDRRDRLSKRSSGMNPILAAFLILAGLSTVTLGYIRFKNNSEASATPVRMNLADLENGAALKNIHLELGSHWRLYKYTSAIYVKGNSADTMQPDSEIKYAFVPIFSPGHKMVKEIKALEDKYDFNIPDEHFPPLQQFSVLVKTTRYKTPREVPTINQRSSKISGMASLRVTDLSILEQKTLTSLYPTIDLRNLIILEAETQPADNMIASTMMALGTLFALFPLFAFLGRRKAPIRTTASLRQRA